MTAPLLITRDQTLIDEILRLGAAAGVAPAVEHQPLAGLRAWLGAPVVLLGVDLLEAMVALQPPYRPGVHVVSWGEVDSVVFEVAMGVGAQDVARLPASDRWLVELLTDLDEGQRRRALTIGVIGGSGGAGATTFACALGQVAAGAGPAIVIDADPVGPGIDRVLGYERLDGIRWDDIQQTTGRLAARSLREAVPQRRGLGALTWPPGPQGTLQAFAAREAVSAAQRGHDTVVVDLPRAVDAAVEEVISRCDQVLVVVRPTVAGVSSAVRVRSRVGGGVPVGIVLHGEGISVREVATVVGVPVLVAMPSQRGLAEAIDLGAGPVRSRRGPLGRAAGQVLTAAREAA